LPEGSEAVLFAFDLIELVGKDLRSAPLEQRKSSSRSSLLQLNEHIFRHVCKLGFEGIVSKRLGWR
jgi:ATP-dependent DNA ligase